MNDLEKDVKYWTDKLAETSEEAMALQQELHKKVGTPMTVEETYKMRTLLTNYIAYSDLLADSVKLMLDYKKPPFWKNLFRK